MTEVPTWPIGSRAARLQQDGWHLFMLDLSKTQLRNHFRQKRNTLSALQCQKASNQLADNIDKTIPNKPITISLYLATDNEISLAPLIPRLREQNHRLCLPILHPTQPKCLWFQPYHPASSMHQNKFNIMEPLPIAKEIIAPWEIDFVLLPLVAYDHDRYRLGMGGGFYDYTFRFMYKKPQIYPRPRLIGCAYSFQQVSHLPHENHDLRMDSIITD